MSERKAKRQISRWQRLRKAARRQIADLRRKLGNLRERFPGRKKKEKRETKRKIDREQERKQKLTAHIERKKKWLRENKEPKPAPASAVGIWDGRQVAGWMVGAAPGPGGNRVNWLAKIKAAGWSGELFSGYRSPEYSESLCYGICKKPSCPGLCAGRSSNHSGSVYPGGAIDVDDWEGFAAANRKVGGPFHESILSSDRPHRSVSGN